MSNVSDTTYVNLSKLTKVENDVSIEIQEECRTNVSEKSDLVLYNDIMNEIRNMNVLSPYKIYYLRGVSADKLLRIIEVYNLVMQNVNEIL